VMGLIYLIIGHIMKKLQFRDIFAFGPFIALSSIVYLFFGPDLIGWYLNLCK
jgi:prepilin signal peptidase PulO-like enzyme (type II secretory pathway)